MAKTLATFRLEETDWKEFHDWARSQGSTATMELSRFVLGKLGKLDVPIPLDSNQLDTKLDALIDSKLEARLKDIQLLDDSNIDDRIATLIDDKLDKRIDEKLSNVELAIAKLAAQEDDPTERIDEVISQLREKEISPILSRLENVEALLEKLEKEEAVPFVNEAVVTDFDLEVDTIPDYSPIFTDPDPIPTSDLEEKIRAYLKKNEGKTTSTSNLFKGLKITDNTDKQYTAKIILQTLGCTQTIIRAGNRVAAAWTIPIHED